MKRGAPKKGRGLLRDAAFTFRDYAANVSPSPEPSARRTRRVFGGSSQNARVGVLSQTAKRRPKRKLKISNAKR